MGTIPWTGIAYRHTAPGRSPLSGEGARLFGGRWNEPNGSSTIYLAHPEQTCIDELHRLLDGQGSGVVRFPRSVHAVSVDGLLVLDLTAEANLEAVGLALTDIASDDWGPCQRVGEAAACVGCQGVLAPSATDAGVVLGVGVVLAVFADRTAPSQLLVLDRRRPGHRRPLAPS